MSDELIEGWYFVKLMKEQSYMTPLRHRGGVWPLGFYPMEIGPRIPPPDELTAQAAELSRLEKLNHSWNREMSMAGMAGSEFHDDPKRCAQFMRDRQSTTMEFAKDNNILRARLTAAEGERDRLREAIGNAGAQLLEAYLEIGSDNEALIEPAMKTLAQAFDAALAPAPASGQPPKCCSWCNSGFDPEGVCPKCDPPAQASPEGRES